jgi:hypothetical protein
MYFQIGDEIRYKWRSKAGRIHDCTATVRAMNDARMMFKDYYRWHKVEWDQLLGLEILKRGGTKYDI